MMTNSIPALDQLVSVQYYLHGSNTGEGNELGSRVFIDVCALKKPGSRVFVVDRVRSQKPW